MDRLTEQTGQQQQQSSSTYWMDGLSRVNSAKCTVHIETRFNNNIFLFLFFFFFFPPFFPCCRRFNTFSRQFLDHHHFLMVSTGQSVIRKRVCSAAHQQTCCCCCCCFRVRVTLSYGNATTYVQYSSGQSTASGSIDITAAELAGGVGQTETNRRNMRRISTSIRIIGIIPSRKRDDTKKMRVIYSRCALRGVDRKKLAVE